MTTKFVLTKDGQVIAEMNLPADNLTELFYRELDDVERFVRYVCQSLDEMRGNGRARREIVE